MANRRSNNEGTIYQLPSGSWRAQIYVNGHRISRTKKSKIEAFAWLRKTLEQVDSGFTGYGTSIQFQDYLQEWLDAKKRIVKQKTWRLYESIIRIHISPHIGKIELKDLEAEHIQALYLSKERQGTGARTINLIHTIINDSLRKAVKFGVIQENPASDVIPPKYTSPEMTIYSEYEISQLLLAAKGSSIELLLHLAITTGLRQSEILGLKWSDINWDRNTISIRRQLLRKCKKPDYFSSPKTKSGIRTIALGKNTIEKLHQHFQLQKKYIANNLERWENNDLIFPSSVGTPLRQRNLHRRFKSLLKSSGLRNIRFHDLRHTAASLMLNHGISPMIVAKRLGHSKVSITLDTYGHLLPGMQQESADFIDQLVTPKSTKLHTNYLRSKQFKEVSSIYQI